MASVPVPQILPGRRAATIHGDLSEEEMATMDQLVKDYGSYRLSNEGQVLKPGMGIGEGIPVGSAEVADSRSGVRGRVLNNDGTELIFPSRVDLSMLRAQLVEEHGSVYGRTVPDEPTVAFRGLYTVIDRHGATRKAEGDASEALVMRVQELQARRFAPVARELFGTPVVVSKMLFANMVLPGQEIDMHHDVPEFRGIHPRTCPNWLQVVMHSSGLFQHWRILQAAALTYFQDMEEGSLAIYCGPQGEGTVVPARRGLGVVVEAETCPHHSDIFNPTPGRRPVPKWPKGVRLQYVQDAGDWTVTAASGEVLERFSRREVRVSTQMKLHCFRDEAEYQVYLDHTDDLSVEMALETLTDDLRRRGRFSGSAPPRADLAVMMVREYVRWPTPEAVAKCWAARPCSVFARALTGDPVPEPSADTPHARL